MASPSRTLLWYLLAGTRGGPNRIRILEELQSSPCNAHQLATALRIDYRTARHHLHLLERNGLVRRPVGNGYAAPYELSPSLAGRLDEIRALPGSGSRGRRTSGRITGSGTGGIGS